MKCVTYLCRELKNINMQVEEKDLIGELEGVPIEIAQAMVNEQVRQGNKANVMVFQDCTTAGMSGGGFAWYNSKEGFDFWGGILYYKDFELFFEKYPRKDSIKNVQTPSGVDYLIINPE